MKEFKYNKSNKSFINELVNKYKKILYLDDWIVTINFKYGESSLGSSYVADTHSDPDYKQITLNVFPCFFDYSKDLQKETLLHELVHSLVKPFDNRVYDLQQGRLVTEQQRIDTNESTTTNITRIIMELI